MYLGSIIHVVYFNTINDQLGLDPFNQTIS